MHDLLKGLNAPVAGKRIAGRAVAKRDGGFFPSESGGLPRRSTECGVRGFRVELRSDIKLLRLECILLKARGQRHDTRGERKAAYVAGLLEVGDGLCPLGRGGDVGRRGDGLGGGKA